MKTRLLCLSLLSLFFLPSAFGQRIRLYNSGQGLPNTQINNVYQDGRGFIWISTENGAAYFDGMRFSSFSHDRNKSGTLAGENVSCVLTDSRGTSWVGTSNGMQRFDYEYNAFRDFQLTADDVGQWKFFINDIAESPDHKRLVAATSGRGLHVFRMEDYSIDQQLTGTLERTIDNGYVSKIFFDAKGYLWVFYSQGGLSVLDLSDGAAKKEVAWEEQAAGISKEAMVSAAICDEATGNLILGTFNHGILIYDAARGHIRRAKGASAGKYRVRALCKSSAQDIFLKGDCVWVGTEDSGLQVFNIAQEEIGRAKIQNSPADLDQCKVHSIIEDNQGNVWVGIYQKGLLVLPKSMYGFEYLGFKGREAGSINENTACITSVVRDPGGELWVGTDGAGLFRVKTDGSVESYSRTDGILPNNSVMALALDKSGKLWISTYMGGITTYTRGEGFREFSRQGDLKRVVCMEYDRPGDKLYMGTYGQGISVLSLKTGELTRFPSREVAGWVRSLLLDLSGRLWVGRADGVRCYDTQSRTQLNYNIGDMASEAQIFSLYRTDDNTVWIGTSEGLVAFREDAEKPRVYTTADGLAGNTICAMQSGSDGSLWISTVGGLSRLNARRDEIKNYHAYDGLQDNEFRFGASWQDPDGRIFFGGINGLTSFYPHIVDQREHPMPKIYFSGFNVFNRRVDYDEALGKNNVLDKHITEATRARLKHSSNVFTIEFAVQEYTNPQKVIYGYRMEGVDNHWHYTDAGHPQATYTNLPNGRYRFHVKASFEGGSGDDVVHNRMEIRILPPWYKSWWMWLVYIGLLGVCLWMLHDWWMRRRVRAGERAEMKRKEMKLRMFTDLSHEIRTPLTLVMTPLKKMREAETDGKTKEMYNLMYRNALRILRIINQLLDMRKVDNNQLKLKFNRTDIVFFVRDIMQSFDHMAMLHNIDFRMVTNRDALEAWVDQGNFDKVLFNIFSNAFKFTPDNGYTLVTLEVHPNHKNSGIASPIAEYMELGIENSGQSIDPEQIDHVFDRFFQIDGSATGGSGIGLHLAKMIVGLHHGTISAANVEGGVKFTVRIPLGNTHLSASEIAADAKHKDLYYKVRTQRIEEAEELLSPSLEEEDEQKSSRRKRNIVLVDDDAELGHYLRMELAPFYNIELCDSGSEAWKIISTMMPDAVITDLSMPGGWDGLELCRKVKQNPSTNHLPVIVLTSMTDEETEQRCMDCGADRYLKKPISLDLLKGAILQAITTRDTIRSKFQSEITPDYQQVQISSPDSKFIAKVIESIRKNLENPEFSVDDLGRDVGMSRVHLNRKLKENINISPSNLIKSIRMKQAAYLLINNKVNISEVAYKVGFSTHSYFSNIFRDYFGMTPKEFVVKYMDTDDKEALSKMFE